MNWEAYLFDENEKPLDRFPQSGISRTAIFRTIGFIGDSFSSGEFEAHPKNGKARGYDLYEYSWGQYIARKNSLIGYNFSMGGMTAKWYLERFADERGFWDPEKACSAYVIALGHNDIYNAHMEIGSIRDIDPVDYRCNKATFTGCYAAIVSRYKEISPDAKFFFVTVPNTEYTAPNPQTQSMINALYAMADYFENAYMIDLYRYGPVHNNQFQKRFYLHNHLNPDGYILTAELIDAYIDYIVRHNPEDFKNAGFINTSIPYK